MSCNHENVQLFLPLLPEFGFRERFRLPDANAIFLLDGENGVNSQWNPAVDLTSTIIAAKNSSCVPAEHQPAFTNILIATNFFDARFWERVHGGSTHWPIVLALTSALLDGAGDRALW
jgi:hypothetical protein